jgi:hypothetical protein
MIIFGTLPRGAKKHLKNSISISTHHEKIRILIFRHFFSTVCVQLPSQVKIPWRAHEIRNLEMLEFFVFCFLSKPFALFNLNSVCQQGHDLHWINIIKIGRVCDNGPIFCIWTQISQHILQAILYNAQTRTFITFKYLKVTKYWSNRSPVQ